MYPCNLYIKDSYINGWRGYKQDTNRVHYVSIWKDVKEYWLFYPNEKTVMVYKLDESCKYGRPEVYSDEDTVKVGIFEELNKHFLKHEFYTKYDIIGYKESGFLC